MQLSPAAGSCQPRHAHTRLKQVSMLIQHRVQFVCTVDLTKSFITSGLTGWATDMPQTLALQAVDSAGNNLTTGGESLSVTVSSPSSASGLPVSSPMTDNADGTYVVTFTVTGEGGDVSVRIQGETATAPSGINAEYYDNRDWLGLPYATTTESEINMDWGSGNVGPVPQGDNVSAIYTGYIQAPKTGTYTMDILGDTQAELTINDIEGILDTSATTDLIGGSYYAFTVKYYEGTKNAKVVLSWQLPSSTSLVPIPASAYFLSRPPPPSSTWTATILTYSIPSHSTISHASDSVVAGEPYTFEIKTKNSAGVTQYDTQDSLTVSLDQSDGLGSTQYTDAAPFHDGDGKYEPILYPTVAGTYSLKVTLANTWTALNRVGATEVDDSPHTVTVLPGPIDPALSSINVPSLPSPYEAGSGPFQLVVDFFDEFMNKIIDITDVNFIKKAIYDNHDAWLSPVGVADDPEWQLTYGTSHYGTVIANEKGTVTIEMPTIYRAGAYELRIKVDGDHVQNSPYLFLEVAPSSISAPDCVPVGVPETMYAGLKYSFQIQSRDAFKNNRQSLLIDAVGENHSADFILVQDNEVSVKANITDAESAGAGVFLVEVEFPEVIKTGEFRVDVLLGGDAMVPPSVTLLPCSDQEAFQHEINLYSAPVILSPVMYTIGAMMEKRELPNAPTFCSSSRTFQTVLDFATVTLSDPQKSKKSISTTQLASYGLFLNQDGGTETSSLSVFTEDRALDGHTIEISFISTTVEEPFWEQQTSVTISFVAEPMITNKLVWPFDTDSVSDDDDDTLQMGKDTDGNQYFLPIDLSCDPWSAALPKIIEEQLGGQFEFGVKIGSQQTFLTYDAALGRLIFEPPEQSVPEASFTVFITLINLSNGFESTQELKVKYEPCQGANWNSFELQYDENPPTPYIESISPYGEVLVRFNETIQQLAVLQEQDLDQSTNRYLQDTIDDDETKVFGKTTHNFKNYSLVHNSTLVLDGKVLPSLQVSLVTADPENSCSNYLDFSWELTSVIKDALTIKLAFETPECVSSSAAAVSSDSIVIAFYNQRLFKGESGSMIQPYATVKSKIGSQMDPESAGLLDSLSTTTTAAMASTGLLGIIFSTVMKSAARKLLNIVKSLQIILNLMLISVTLVAHVHFFVQSLQEIIFADMYGIQDIREMGTAQTDATADAEEVPKLSTVFYVLAFGPVIVLVLYLSSRFCLNHRLKAFFKDQLTKTLYNRLIVFLDSSLLVFFVYCVITGYNAEQKETAQVLNFYSAIAFQILIIPAYYFLVGYIVYHKARLNEECFLSRFGALYRNLSLKRNGTLVFAYLLLAFARKIALSFMVTLCRSNFVTQLCFFVYTSIIMIAIVSTVRPFESKSEIVLELANEFWLLLILAHCMTQTEFVLEPRNRMVMGWSLIASILVNVALNLGFFAFRGIRAACTKVKLIYLRYQARKRHKELLKQRQAALEKSQIALKTNAVTNTDQKSLNKSNANNCQQLNSSGVGLENKDLLVESVNVDDNLQGGVSSVHEKEPDKQQQEMEPVKKLISTFDKKPLTQGGVPQLAYSGSYDRNIILRKRVNVNSGLADRSPQKTKPVFQQTMNSNSGMSYRSPQKTKPVVLQTNSTQLQVKLQEDQLASYKQLKLTKSDHQIIASQLFSLPSHTSGTQQSQLQKVPKRQAPRPLIVRQSSLLVSDTYSEQSSFSKPMDLPQVTSLDEKTIEINNQREQQKQLFRQQYPGFNFVVDLADEAAVEQKTKEIEAVIRKQPSKLNKQAKSQGLQEPKAPQQKPQQEDSFWTQSEYNWE